MISSKEVKQKLFHTVSSPASETGQVSLIPGSQGVIQHFPWAFNSLSK